MLEVILGQVPEAVYFALFMIYTKQLKEKRLLFLILMILQYLILKQFLKYTIYFQILYTALTYVILKILYKDKAQITDVFTFTIGSIILIVISFVSGMLNIIRLPNGIRLLNQVQCSIINRVLLFSILFLLRNKLYKIQKLYKKLWNRNDKVKKKIKSTTFRSLNVIAFNVIFYVINIGMILAIIWERR